MNSLQQVYLHFHPTEKIVFLEGHYTPKKPLWNQYIVVATWQERETFLREFVSKGRYSCTFNELKKYIDFNGVRFKDRSYGTINIDQKLYKRMFETLDFDGDNMDYMMLCFIYSLEEQIFKNESSQSKKMAKKYTKEYIKTLIKQLELSLKVIDN